MDVTVWAWVAAALGAVAWVCAWALGLLDQRSRRIRRLLNKIPGKPQVPFIGTAYIAFGAERQDFFKILHDLTKKYWPTFRVWNGFQGEVHFSDADHIETILSSSVNISKSHFYDLLLPWLGEGLLTSTGQKWHSHRKLLTPAFHFKILDNFVDVFGEKSEVLVRRLEEEVGNSGGFDVYPYITLCALDIICETAMGTEINAQDHEDLPYVKTIYETSRLVLQRFLKPWQYSSAIYYRTAPGKRFLKDLDILHDFTRKVIKERKEAMKDAGQKGEEAEDNLGRKKRLAFLDLLLEASKGGAVLSDEEIREEVDTFMFEGHDTTSAGMCWSLFLLGLHPDVQEKVYKEQMQIFQGSNRKPTMNDLAEMKYLERVIKEVLRLYPSVPFIGRKITQDIQVGEHLLPEGAHVMLHIYHAHRNPKHFPNPDNFDPDNFLPERVQGRHPFAYVPFSAGSRNCIGQKFALLEEKAVLSAVVRSYRLRALERPEDITLMLELILRPEGGIRLTVERR